MILPTKHLPVEKSLLAIGAEILLLLEEPITISRLWSEFTNAKNRTTTKKIYANTVTYDWFVLALDLLYFLDTIKLEFGLLRRVN